MYSSNCYMLDEEDSFDVRTNDDSTYIHIVQGQVRPLLISCEEKQLIDLHDKIEEALWDISEHRKILSERVIQQEVLIDELRERIDSLQSNYEEEE